MDKMFFDLLEESRHRCNNYLLLHEVLKKIEAEEFRETREEGV